MAVVEEEEQQGEGRGWDRNGTHADDKDQEKEEVEDEEEEGAKRARVAGAQHGGTSSFDPARHFHAAGARVIMFFLTKFLKFLEISNVSKISNNF